MPIIYGIAALAVLANGMDQGVDPQIDKQYAIVKSGKPSFPVSTTPNTSQPEDVAVSPKAANRQICLPQDQSSEQTGSVTFRAGQGTVLEVPVNITTAGGSGFAHVEQVATGQRPSTARVPGVAMFSGDVLSRLKGMDRPVSVQFSNATASDVLKWLTKQNVNFVANVDKLPRTKISMNVKDVPLHEALETVAEALGGSWSVRGKTLIFQGNIFHMYAPARVGSTNGFEFKTFGDMKGFSQMDEKQMKAYSLNLKDFPKMDSKALDEFKSLHGLTQDGKAFEFKTIDPKMLDKLKSLQGLTKDGKPFEFKTIDPKAFAELKSFHGFAKDGKTLNLKSFSELKGLKGLTFKKIDTEKFLKSLTNSQKDLMKKQGHLKFSDLTDAQKAMILDGPNKELPKDFTFMFNMNGEKVVIKN
jgi:hypothetical protein